MCINPSSTCTSTRGSSSLPAIEGKNFFEYSITFPSISTNVAFLRLGVLRKKKKKKKFHGLRLRLLHLQLVRFLDLDA